MRCGEGKWTLDQIPLGDGAVVGAAWTLANIGCLSGIAGAPGGKPLVFSILKNDTPSPAARAAQDRFTATLVGYLDPTLHK